ncbi:cold-shock protein [Oscillatoria acuminata]|uniref:cold-shock protein n=1 Tax=Oscillatoria acuminata TaxID=118323 RepID=UPI00254603F3|nr:cold shock domain-containing protein [Oscillatoria acuminata]
MLAKVTYSQFEATRRKAFTTDLITQLNEDFVTTPAESPALKRPQSAFVAAQVEREQGTVTKFSNIRGFGFIRGKHEQDIFVHFRDIRGDEQRLNAGDVVEFVLLINEKGLNAKAVEIVSRSSS